MIALDSLTVRNRRALAEWLRRLANHIDGPEAPDPRDQELRDRGATIEFQARIQHRKQHRRRQ